MNIVGTVTGVKYKILLTDDLKEVDIKDFDINKVPSACLLTDNKYTFAISKWVSPKRTCSYSLERVFNTLHILKKITVIPVVKDEGAKGDRDFIQWDTVSLMSLLDVFVIFAYYTDAEKLNQKITNQQFDNEYVESKIREIEEYHSSALHWNLNELNTGLHNIIDKVKEFYAKIEQSTRVKLHNSAGLDNFKEKIDKRCFAFHVVFKRKSRTGTGKRICNTTTERKSLHTFKSKNYNNQLSGRTV
jgi:hypothetical protein